SGRTWPLSKLTKLPDGLPDAEAVPGRIGASSNEPTTATGKMRGSRRAGRVMRAPRWVDRGRRCATIRPQNKDSGAQGSPVTATGRGRGLNGHAGLNGGYSIPAIPSQLLLERRPGEKAAHVRRECGDRTREVFGHVGRDVRGHQHVRHLPERTVRRQRLGREDVERGARDATVSQRVYERVLVDEAAARDVHQHPFRLHGSEFLRAHPPAGHRRAGRGHDEPVGGGEQVRKLLAPDEFVDSRDRAAPWLATAEPDGAHAEGLRTQRDRAADRADADEPDGPTL